MTTQDFNFDLKAFDAGCAAFLAGAPESANPYRDGAPHRITQSGSSSEEIPEHISHMAWDHGWSARSSIASGHGTEHSIGTYRDHYVRRGHERANRARGE